MAQSLGSLASGTSTSTCCSIVLETTEMPPTTICTGLVSTPRASFSTADGKVAEKSTVCLSGRVLPMIRSICGAKPISNMRSASSSTTYVIRWRLVTRPPFAVSMSIIRPGVHTSISAPRLSSAICCLIAAPPYTATTRSEVSRENLRISRYTCEIQHQIHEQPSLERSASYRLLARNNGGSVR
eukprot:5542852-Pleurochrysis_carterae.AAC.1